MSDALNIGKLKQSDQIVIAKAKEIAKSRHMSLSGWVLELIAAAVRSDKEAAKK